ncbi:hypothetical protein M407DRAFT_243625 [Tulasnella calospora MUT 4182]|uniref:Uncharacterized protein n=1 Tax=Tulasnella calospora MUT 4182 TaxID=1051891 RepID=A0A0C3QIF0_9AGAM|nr:hypothetical protein M407DRAFT_243625 [Tulasnella calospora MUT 4182]
MMSVDHISGVLSRVNDLRPLKWSEARLIRMKARVTSFSFGGPEWPSNRVTTSPTLSAPLPPDRWSVSKLGAFPFLRPSKSDPQYLDVRTI